MFTWLCVSMKGPDLKSSLLSVAKRGLRGRLQDGCFIFAKDLTSSEVNKSNGLNFSFFRLELLPTSPCPMNNHIREKKNKIFLKM